MKPYQVLLLPVSLLYGIILALRNLLFDFGVLPTKSFGLPIISVGNLSTGGTGKTPHIEYLANLLKDDFILAVLSRGYGRKSSGFLLALESSTAIEVGDEPLQVKRKFPELEVAVCASRAKGMDKLLQAHPNLQAVLLDDAFQHRYVKPSLSILLTDYSRLYVDDFVLPSGNLREFKSGAARADAIIVTKTPSIFSPLNRRLLVEKLKPKPYQKVFFSYTNYGENLVSLNNSQPSPLNKDYYFDKYAILLVTGLANSLNLEYYIKEKARNFRHLAYPDHYRYTLKDIKQIQNLFDNIVEKNKIIITTEKDAMRLSAPELREQVKGMPLFYLPIEVKFHGDDGQEFNGYIQQHVKQNQRNSSFFTRENKILT